MTEAMTLLDWLHIGAGIVVLVGIVAIVIILVSLATDVRRHVGKRPHKKRRSLRNKTR